MPTCMRAAARFADATQALDAAQGALAAAEERWLALEMQREELEGREVWMRLTK